MVTVPVNRIIPFSSVDGPGSRTAVFLQGCNINCRYCHNPETRNLCIACGSCVQVCPAGALTYSENGHDISYDAASCIMCDACIKICNYDSSPRIQKMDAEQVFERIKRQMPFIRGVTVSGGECSLYPDFLRELFLICKEAGLHTLIDSNGTVLFESLKELLDVTDGVMLDIKAYSKKDHEAVTGAANDIVIENAKFLANLGKLYEIRTVVLPELFDVEETVRNSANLLSQCSHNNKCAADTVRYKLITYREQGVREIYRIYDPPSKTLMERLRNLAYAQGIKHVIVV